MKEDSSGASEVLFFQEGNYMRFITQPNEKTLDLHDLSLALMSCYVFLCLFVLDEKCYGTGE
jgi:hypothetical protein